MKCTEAARQKGKARGGNAIGFQTMEFWGKSCVGDLCGQERWQFKTCGQDTRKEKCEPLLPHCPKHVHDQGAAIAGGPVVEGTLQHALKGLLCVIAEGAEPPSTEKVGSMLSDLMHIVGPMVAADDVVKVSITCHTFAWNHTMSSS